MTRPARDSMARRHAALSVSLLALAGCASEPPTRFHTLVPSFAENSAVQAGSGQGARAWTLQSVRVPVQVDRPQLVLLAADGSLAVLENERWIAPLSDELQAAVAQSLQRRLGLPEPASAEAARIDVEVQRFESALGRGARIEARWTVQPGRGDAAAARQCHASFDQAAAGAGFPALAAAHRAALERLSGAIAASVDGACPGAPGGVARESAEPLRAHAR